MTSTLTGIYSPKQADSLSQQYRVVRRSIDARQRELKVNLTLLTDAEGHPITKDAPLPLYEPPVWQDVHNTEKTVRIIGAGPAGLFAALTCIEHGWKPIIFERGKDVSERKKDIALLNRNIRLDAESNYCFGEGGAGTFSDGKLFSRSKKRGNMQRVMELFHYFGADDTVLYETHAHIGSDKLPTIIKAIRQCIIEQGGEVHFGYKVTATELRRWLDESPVLLAIGHSSHDTYFELAELGVPMQVKGMAMGVRVEHPQYLINQLLYHLQDGVNDPVLKYVGNASYSLVTQVDGRGVYSFCMCPGGHIVPAASSAQGCVVNGMSASHRNSPYANSGMVVQVKEEDIHTIFPEAGDDGLAGLRMQEWLESLAMGHGQAPAIAPAQRLADFVCCRQSADLPPCSFLPGIKSSKIDTWMPQFITRRLQAGFREFDRKYPGFLTNDAVVLAVESRTSSAVRIVRDTENLRSLFHPNLYPCGEGAGYAGGITSSALDGINAAYHAVINR